MNEISITSLVNHIRSSTYFSLFVILTVYFTSNVSDDLKLLIKITFNH